MKCEISTNGTACTAPADLFAQGKHRCIGHAPRPSTSCSHSLAPSGSCAYCGTPTERTTP